MSSSREMTNEQKMARYYDANFPKMTIRAFVAEKLNVQEANVADVLFAALKSEKQTDENKQLIAKALDYSVNASGAIVLFVNTQDGLQLVAAESQRRATVVASNGACEDGESMAMTAMREFIEELGNPAPTGLLRTIASNPENCVSVEETNQIGVSAEGIANRIVEKKANKASLYVNYSAVYVNASPVNISILKQELAALTEKLTMTSAYYQPAVDMMFGKPPVNLDDADAKNKAVMLINQFKRVGSSVISDNFSSVFAKTFDDSATKAMLKEALLAMIDLTENKSMQLIPCDELLFLLSLDLKNSQVEEDLKKQYFVPALQNIALHKGALQPSQYLALLSNRLGMARKMDLGFVANNAPQNASTSSTQSADLAASVNFVRK